MRHFPDLISTYLEFTAGHESTDRLRKWSFISVLAACMERRMWLDRGYYTLYPNLYTFIIGRSGLIKKSTSTGIAVNLLREVKGICMMSERLTAASLIHQLSAAGKKFELNGNKINQSPVFAYASELAVFLEEVYGGITQLLTTFYDCQPNDSSKPWVHQTVGDGARAIYGPCLNLLGASTKAWLTKCIPKTEMEGGFTSRIIFVVENRAPDKLVAWPELNADTETMRAHLVEDMKTIYSMAGSFHVEPKAKTFFSDWYHHHMTKVLPQNMDPRMVGYMSRKGDTILKLAMIKSAAESNDLKIRKEHLEWGLAEIDALEPDWRGAFDGLGLQGGMAWDIRNFIRTSGGTSRVNLMSVFASQYPSGEVAREVNELLEMGDVLELGDRLIFAE